MKLSIRNWVLALLVSFSAGCYYDDGDLFWVERNGAVMPVWVRGNTDSGVFIIFNHGGPGSSSIFEAYLESSPGDGSIDGVSPLKAFEDRYAMVYWDQRHQGNAQGSANPDGTTWEDFGADAELVVDALGKRHDVESLFMIGQSWGQAVGTIYMTLGDRWETRQAKLDGYIDYKGNISANQPYTYAVPKATAIAQEHLEVGNNVEFWNKCRDFWDSHDEITTPSEFVLHSDCIDTAMGGLIAFGERIKTSVAFTFISPHSGWYHWANNKATTRSTFMERVVAESPLLQTAHRVQVPTLMIHGRLDLQSLPEVGQWYYDTIETPPEDKTLLILEDSPHGAVGADVQILQDSIIDFVEDNR
ncbi:MAG: alpha/beta hydrolase [Nannocystaceae bacterium]|nr:alpha/beta hydrolase [Nannocystaceae bacterium]